MHIELTKEQMKEMLIAAMFYSWIRGGLADAKGEDFKEYERLQAYLLKAAKENGHSNMVEEFRGGLLPSDGLSGLVDSVIEEYDEDVFWHELVLRLGKRDFYRTVTPEENEEMRKKEWLPERVHELYEKYEKEFEDHGVERMTLETGN